MLKIKELTLNIGQNQSLIKFFKFVLRQFEYESFQEYNLADVIYSTFIYSHA